MKNKASAAVILVVAILILFCGNLGLHFKIDVNGARNLNFSSSPEYIEVYEEFDNIEQVELNLSHGDLKIVSGDRFSLKGSNVDENSYHCTVYEKTLNIEEKIRSNIFSGNASYILTVPSAVPLLKITANCSGGTVRFNDVSAGEIVFHVEKGSLEGFNLVTTKLNIDAGMGSINLHKIQSQNVNIASGMGSVNIDCKINGDDGNISVDSQLGSVNLRLDNNPADFYFELAKRNSSVNIDGVKAVNYKYYNNDSANSKYGLIIGSGLSSVEICFENNDVLTE